MIRFDFLVEYFENYKISSEENKNSIIEDLINDLYTRDFVSSEMENLIYGSLYENIFEISHKRKIIFINKCLPKILKNFKTAEEYEEYAKSKNFKSYRFVGIGNDCLKFEIDIEKYICRSIYFYLKRESEKKFNNNFFKCKMCGGFFSKSNNPKVTVYNYCPECKKDARHETFRKAARKARSVSTHHK